MRRVKQSVVKVIGGIEDTTAASALTAGTPVEAATLYTVASPPPPPPPPPDPGSSSAWTSGAVDLIECVECAAEVAQRRSHRRRNSLRLSALPASTDSCKVGFCTCLRQPHASCRTPSCFAGVGWASDRAPGLQKTPLRQSAKVSSEGFEFDEPQANT